MKHTASNPRSATEHQKKDSRSNPVSPPAARREPVNPASASQKTTARARQGEPLNAENNSDRSPKQENL